MKIALCLCGGGSLGSYEIGAIEKLYEKGLSFDIVTGSSVGALNGYFVATHEFDKAISFWESVTMSDIIKHGFNTNKEAISKAFENRALQARTFIASYFQNAGVDIAPYKELLGKAIDLKKIKDEKAAKLGVVFTAYPSGKEMRALLNEEEEEMIMHHLLSSSACFPIFPVHKIGKKSFIDGGWTNNLPIDYALELGADYVYAVGLRSFPPMPQKPQYYHLPNVKLIMQSRDLGFMMDFDPKTLARNRIMGYLDAGRVLGDYNGIAYAFEKADTDYEVAHHYFMKALSLGAKRIKALKALFGIRGMKVDEIGFYVAALEYFAHSFGVNEFKLYSLDSMLQELKEKASSQGNGEKKVSANKRYLSDLILGSGVDKNAIKGVSPKLLLVPSLL